MKREEKLKIELKDNIIKASKMLNSVYPDGVLLYENHYIAWNGSCDSILNLAYALLIIDRLDKIKNG